MKLFETVGEIHDGVWPDETLSDGALNSLTRRIEVVRDAATGEKLKRRSNESALQQKYGRLFLQHSAAAKADIPDPRQLKIQGELIEAFRQNIEAIDKMTIAEDAVRASLEAEKPLSVRFRPNAATAVTWVAGGVETAWCQDGKQKPPAKNSLCDFVTKALAAAGLHYSPATVNEILRGRPQNRKRSGKGHPAKKRRPV